ncbi:TetR family transcriptional regulator [Bacillus sp. 1P06AnD]|uniref:TetR family transcriptional regulator n=1 Tax=Bacillus sp. 1P06AnD TaxID=3132208 RepID=UPI0039A00BED
MAKKAEKYQLILSAAIKVISEKGIEKTSISDIVKESGVAQGTFYLYFASKSALIPAIAEQLLDNTLKGIQQAIKDSETTIGMVVNSMIEETFKLTEKNKRIIALCYSGLAFDNSFDRWEEIYKPYYTWLEEQLQRAVEQKEITADIHIKRTGKILIGLIEDAAERYYLGNDRVESLAEQKQELKRFIHGALGIQ